jgi:hypothetical protein
MQNDLNSLKKQVQESIDEHDKFQSLNSSLQCLSGCRHCFYFNGYIIA